MSAQPPTIESLDADGREEIEARDWLEEKGEKLTFDESTQPETDNLKHFMRRSTK